MSFITSICLIYWTRICQVLPSTWPHVSLKGQENQRPTMTKTCVFNIFLIIRTQNLSSLRVREVSVKYLCISSPESRQTMPNTHQASPPLIDYNLKSKFYRESSFQQRFIYSQNTVTQITPIIDRCAPFQTGRLRDLGTGYSS